jgi:hypothetical protein
VNAGRCGSVLAGTAQRSADVANNVVALLTAGGITLLLLAVLTLTGRWNAAGRRLPVAGLVGFGITVALYVVTAVAFAIARPQFTAYGHSVAAGAMFAFIYANVWLNAVNLYFAREQRGGVLNRYTVIGVLMTAAAVGSAVLALEHWPYAVLVIETSLIVLFAAFWALQTAELWNQGLRQPAPLTPGPSRPRS